MQVIWWNLATMSEEDEKKAENFGMTWKRKYACRQGVHRGSSRVRGEMLSGSTKRSSRCHREENKDLGVFKETVEWRNE